MSSRAESQTNAAGGLAERQSAVRRVLWRVLWLNLLVSAIKAAAALLTGSVAALAEVVHGILDASSNVIGLVGLSYAKDPPDEQHPYGHHRFESLAALAVGILIAGGLVEVLRALWDGIFGDRKPPQISLSAAALMASTVVINFLVSRYEARRGRELTSHLLTADAAHTFSDGLGVLVVLASFAGMHFGLSWADTVAAFIVSVLIGRTALIVLRDNAEALLDTAQLDPAEVRAIAMEVSGVRKVRAVRSRGRPDQVALDLCIQVDGDVSVATAHHLSHVVEDALRERMVGLQDVVIHIEPFHVEQPVARPSHRAG